MVVVHLSAALLKDHLRAPVHVQRIHFDEIVRTKYDAITQETSGVFAAKDVGGLIECCNDAASRMARDGLFENVSVRLSAARGQGGDGQAVPVEVTFLVEEPKFIRANVNAGVTNRGESQLGTEANLLSVFGRGEKFSAIAEIGHRKSSLFNLSFVKPLLGGRETKLGVHASRTYYEWPWNQLSGLETGIAADVAHSTFKDQLRHILRLQADWREIGCTSRATAFAVREHCGHSLKTSVKSILTHSTEDSGILATSGHHFQIMQELAGLLTGTGDFLRHELTLRQSFPFIGDLFGAISFQGKHVAPMKSGRLSLIDRVYLGGHTDLRGFGHCSIGPAEDGAFLGGMGSLAAAAHLYKPLFPPRYFFAHAFAAVGSVCPFSSNSSFRDVTASLTKNQRYSLGLGVTVKLADVARLEVNYCWPISQYAGDVKQPGLQFGVGVSFL